MTLLSDPGWVDDLDVETSHHKFESHAVIDQDVSVEN
jgi:hypothetical protein